MKTKILTLHFLLFFVIPAYSQSSWHQQIVPNDINFLLSIDFADTAHGVSCGWYNFSGRAICTTNGGANWLHSQIPDSSRSLVTVQFVSSQTGYIAGAYNVTSWPNNRTSVHTKHHLPKNGTIRKLYSEIGIDTLPMYEGFFLKSTDFGTSWSTYGTLPDTIYYLIGLYFLNPNTGYVTADMNIYSGSAAILKTTTGGLNWSVLVIPPGIATLWNVYFLNMNTGFAYGYSQPNDTTFISILLTTTDGGQNWGLRNFPDIQNITSLDFPDSVNGILIGSGIDSLGMTVSKAYRTTDGGVSWSGLSLQINNAVFRGVKFVRGSGTGIIYSDIADTNIYVSRTTNYGSTWTTYQVNEAHSLLSSACLLNQNDWYLSGGYFSNKAVILHSSNGGNPIGIVPVSNNVPGTYSLSQNYPNPFNPVTKIRFDTPPLPSPKERGAVSVRLVVYDILGREVATLVNERLKPGSYEVKWDGSSYPSGVYFYRLFIHNASAPLSITKKMVLIR